MIESRFPDAPDAIKALPVDKRGFPIPWFVDYVNGEPDFRVMNKDHFLAAMRENLCWICGGHMNRRRLRCFVIGPMCIVNRTTSEPPSHLECARFAARSCPFLTTPKAVRNERGLPEGTTAAGIMIKRNPGVTCIGGVERYRPFPDPSGMILFDIGRPLHVQWFAYGQEATRAEVQESIDTGLPLLRKLAEDEEGGVEFLEQAVRSAQRYLPA